MANDFETALKWVNNNKSSITSLLNDPKISNESREIYITHIPIYETVITALLRMKEIESGGWLPIETAPMNKEVWCYLPDFGKGMSLVCELEPTGMQYPKGDARQQYAGMWRRPDRNSFAQSPTHWQPLPAAPINPEEKD